MFIRLVSHPQVTFLKPLSRELDHPRLLSTASFLADFAFEAGLPTPQFFLTRDPVTEKSLVDENQGRLWIGESCLFFPWGPKSGMDQINSYMSSKVHFIIYIYMYMYVHVHTRTHYHLVVYFLLLFNLSITYIYIYIIYIYILMYTKKTHMTYRCQYDIFLAPQPRFETLAEDYEQNLASPPTPRRRTWWLPWNMKLGMKIPARKAAKASLGP